MVDNATFYCGEPSVIEHLTASFFRERIGLFEKVSNNLKYDFFLYNPESESKKNYIRVSSMQFGEFLQFKGSLRKWYLADDAIGDSLEDFTKQEYDNALKLLFSLLEIPDENRRYFNMSRIEIGLTFQVEEVISIIMNSICGYDNAWYKLTNPWKGCKKYSTDNNTFTVYDKGNEMLKHLKGKRKNKGRLMEMIGKKNYLRMEFTLTGGRKEIEDQIVFKTLEDTVDLYGWFYLYYWEKIQKIIFDDIFAKEPIFDPKGKGKGVKGVTDFIKYYGMYKLGEVEMNRIVEESNDPKGARRAIKRIHESAPIRNTSYNIHSLFKDVKKQLICLMKKSDYSHLVKELILKKRDI